MARRREFIEAHPKDTFCSYCGNRFRNTDSYPRECDFCGNETYLNAPAVGIGLVPINNGLLTVRRNIQPMKGGLALPGGYKNVNETWQEGIAREVFEETGIQVDASRITNAGVRTAHNGAVLVFGLCERLLLPEPVEFKICPIETQECKIIDHRAMFEETVGFVFEQEQLCFPLHQEMMEWFFNNVI